VTDRPQTIDVVKRPVALLASTWNALQNEKFKQSRPLSSSAPVISTFAVLVTNHIHISTSAIKLSVLIWQSFKKFIIWLY